MNMCVKYKCSLRKTFTAALGIGKEYEMYRPVSGNARQNSAVRVLSFRTVTLLFSTPCNANKTFFSFQ